MTTYALILTVVLYVDPMMSMTTVPGFPSQKTCMEAVRSYSSAQQEATRRTYNRSKVSFVCLPVNDEK